MCRLFGFRSVIDSGVHQSLVKAENALIHQSTHHPDGWGLAYYVEGAPHVMKSSATAIEDELFKKLTGIVNSKTVLAHIRKATLGQNMVTNTHPFQYGNWVFAHNGNIKDFASHRLDLQKDIAEDLSRFLLGETDSETLFLLMLTYIRQSQHSNWPDKLTEATQKLVTRVESVCGPLHHSNQNNPNETYLSFIITNGQVMMAHQGGQALHYSTYKSQCSERDHCPMYAPECENPTDQHVNHLLLSSEPLEGENIWSLLKPYEIIGVDEDMHLFTGNSKQQK